MSWKEALSGYFTFSRKDRIGTIALLLLIALIFSLAYFAPSPSDAPVPVPDSLLVVVKSLEPKEGQRYAATDESFVFEPTPTEAGALFFFDPNTLDADGWRRLGLRDKTIKTIHNYRTKGGRFYKPEDLSKIWGLPKGFYERVKPYIRLPQPEGQTARADFEAAPKAYTPKAPTIIEVNTADTTALIALPGIGSKLAGRIVAFRNKLGGFASLSQIAETYGLPDSTFQKIKSRLSVDVSGVKKININTAAKEELKMHPYIKWALANAIVAYREQHGAFLSVDDVKKSMLMDETLFEKLKPYLSL